MKTLACLACLAAAPVFAQSYPEADAIVSIGGPVTEIIYALGEGDRIIARDTTSLYPPEVEELPDVGYMRQLSAEGVLSVGPDLIVTRDTAGPPEVIDQLEAASIPVVGVPDGYTEDTVLAAIRTIGTALGVEAEAERLAGTVADDFAELGDLHRADPPRVMFILSNQGGRLNVAGDDTGANGILALAGAENVMAADYKGYKIMSDEAIIAAAPDVVVMMTGEEEHEARRGQILSLPAIAQTPAGQNGAFVTVDPAALSFGPRTADFARELNAALDAAVGG
ncbi:heme/hemin ABC transporter substrate-binding protein [Celeribacter indicus]|uniref:Periplasmic binding protein n=1 Tax=Celeribacter indicus TaxID=1208324 RepID=A0A0B5DY60_9RHOB|nr:ABC transporter substrate-binding protein [Celeribacter indicus]AJE48383.1 periplasmic binding protein [Celeribacter indicus]SDW74485.1 iron complex transport system substrate-binding protein [Celeribacter indicus]